MKPWNIPHRTDSVTRADGLRVSYSVFGSHERTFVIANGHGAPQSVWHGIFDVLIPHCQIIIWDYLAQHSSDVPQKDFPIGIASHCSDLDLILEQEHITRYMMGGWSLGVQVALAQYERDRERIDGLALLHGVPGRIMHHVLNARPEYAFPITRFLRVALRFGGVIPQKLIHRIAMKPSLSLLYEGLGLVKTTHTGFADLVRAFSTLDLSIYLGVALRADAHTTDHWLHTIAVPTLVTLGAQDVITPSETARPLFEVIPDVDLQVYEGSHFPMFEAPATLTKQLLTLVERSASMR